jgi:site-specific recombinase XerD
MTLDELTAAINKLREYKTMRGETYTPNTIADHIQIFKLFFIWLIKRKMATLTRDDIADLRSPMIPETLEAKDLLVRAEIAEMIAACKNSIRDQAIIAVTFESAARIKEAASLRWRDLEYTVEGVIRLSIRDIKTQKLRYPPLLMSVEYLAAWRRVYPGTPDGDAFIFTDSVSGSRMQYRAIAYVITRAAARAGIKKKSHHTVSENRGSRRWPGMGIRSV